MRLVFAGTPEVATPTLRALKEANHDIVGVITREDAPQGRKRVLTPSAVAVVADELGIPIYKTNRLDDAARQWLTELAPEAGVVVAYGGLLGDDILAIPPLGWVNLHFSALPKWRGAAPVQRALMAGEQELGMTVFRLVRELDAGDILTRGTNRFEEGTTAGEALDRLANEGTALVTEALAELSSNPAAGDPQQGDSSYAHKLEREDGKLDLRETSAAVLAHWAGVTPAPGAHVTVDGQPLKVLRLQRPAASATSGEKREPVGTATISNRNALLWLKDAPLELKTVQPAGKKAMPAVDWLRGRGGRAELS